MARLVSDDVILQNRYEAGVSHAAYGRAPSVYQNATEQEYYNGGYGQVANNTSSNSTSATSTSKAAVAPTPSPYDVMRAQVQASSDGRISQMQADWQRQQQALQDAYAQSITRLKADYDTLYGQLKSDYEYGTGQINSNSDRALQEAYVNRMMQQRNLNQNLAAMGRAGGAAESTMLNLANGYGRQRGETERNRTTNLAGVTQSYNNAVAQGQSQYNQALNSYEMNQLQNKMSLDQYYQNMLDNAKREVAAQLLQLSIQEAQR